jgi:hypothetical protein
MGTCQGGSAMSNMQRSADSFDERQDPTGDRVNIEGKINESMKGRG